MQIKIKVTLCAELAFWVGIFERIDDEGLSAARVIFGKEPTDPELYEWLNGHYDQLKFSAPQDFKLVVKRKNPKRLLREVKKELSKMRATRPETFAQEAIRVELELQKKVHKTQSKADKDAEEKLRFQLHQKRKKQKKRGH